MPVPKEDELPSNVVLQPLPDSAIAYENQTFAAANPRSCECRRGDGAHAQNYHTFTPARDKDWTMAWESSSIRYTPTTGARGNYVVILTAERPTGRSRRSKVRDVQLK